MAQYISVAFMLSSVTITTDQYSFCITADDMPTHLSLCPLVNKTLENKRINEGNQMKKTNIFVLLSVSLQPFFVSGDHKAHFDVV